MDEAVKDESVAKAILDILTKESKNNTEGHECVKWIHVSNKLFSVGNGTLTPTLKISGRTRLKYQKELDALYALGEPQSTIGLFGSYVPHTYALE